MIDTPQNPELQTLCDYLASVPDDSSWPADALQRCADAGFYRWFVSKEHGGFGWSSTDIAKGYLELSKANLTVTFILTQRVAALRRIAGCQNENLKKRLIEPLLAGETSATVGISHLTTSRQHLGKPVLSAIETETENGFRVDGMSPWVTGGCGADLVLMGASIVDRKQNADGAEVAEVTTLRKADQQAQGPGNAPNSCESGYGLHPNGQEILFVVETANEKVTVKPGFDLVALAASQTGAIHVADLLIPASDIVAGPVAQVLTGNGGGAGGLQTSVLALGLVKAAIDFIESEAQRRSDLASAQTSLREQHESLCRDLFAATDGSAEITAAEIRSQSNSLALRATQSALVAAKGAGFVTGHPVGRWCREALFFLVWSCPQEVSQANLDEFAPCN